MMTPDQEKKLDDMHTCITRMDTAFFGKGGVQDRVIDHEDRLRLVETAQTKTGAGIKTLLAIASSGGVLGALASKLLENHK